MAFESNSVLPTGCGWLLYKTGVKIPVCCVSSYRFIRQAAGLMPSRDPAGYPWGGVDVFHGAPFFFFSVVSRPSCPEALSGQTLATCYSLNVRRPRTPARHIHRSARQALDTIARASLPGEEQLIFGIGTTRSLTQVETFSL